MKIEVPTTPFDDYKSKPLVPLMTFMAPDLSGPRILIEAGSHRWAMLDPQLGVITCRFLSGQPKTIGDVEQAESIGYKYIGMAKVTP